MDWLFLDLLLGYGRSPWRALIPSAFFVAVGTFVFWRYSNQVIERKPDETKRRYNESWRTLDPFWFSLDLFVPVIDLDAATIWMPKTSWKSGWYCLRALRILGWILVPLIVAALTGIIK
jgi:sterol desaturase/sphingolipid hydroxylase (fatty acid hydroxylase superfamily)